MAKNPIGHKRTKHIDIKPLHKRNVQAGTVTLMYCPTNKMVADTFTKALPRPHYENLRDQLGLIRHNY